MHRRLNYFRCTNGLLSVEAVELLLEASAIIIVRLELASQSENLRAEPQKLE